LRGPIHQKWRRFAVENRGRLVLRGGIGAAKSLGPGGKGSGGTQKIEANPAAGYLAVGGKVGR